MPDRTGVFAKLIFALAVLGLALAVYVFAVFQFGRSAGGAGPGALALGLAGGVAASGLAAFGLAAAIRRVDSRAWIGLGLLLLASLVWLDKGGWYGSGPSANPSLWPAVVLSALALVAAALLLHAGLAATQRGMTAIYLGLGALLAAKALHSLYWATIWDSTYDPLTYILIVLPGLATVLAGLTLTLSLAGRAKAIGAAYVLLIPALLIAVSALGQRVDFRALTEARAERVRQAVEAYQSRAGRYPADLPALGAWQRLRLAGPLILYGQDWCYRGADDYYELGYVTRAHWSDPRLTAQRYAARGTPPDQPALCAAEIDAIRAIDPAYHGASPE